jgi:SMC interacting uncharacterized protein involved in chromosome segregation
VEKDTRTHPNRRSERGGLSLISFLLGDEPGKSVDGDDHPPPRPLLKPAQKNMRAARRKTLSGAENSQLNARAQPLGDASAVSAKHAAAASRVQSRNQGKPTNSQRRHSVYFSSGQTPRVDPRPLGDKAYINSCIKQLISFLGSHGFDSALSPKTLAAPTAKEFAALSLFLFRQADENFKFGSKTEDDVPTVFKQLRYPFQISKSALYAVGSPHTWPSLLTALTWLVQIYIYEEEAGRNEAKVNSALLQESFSSQHARQNAPPLFF